VVGEEHKFLLLVLVPDHHPAKEVRAVFLGIEPGKADTLIREKRIAEHGDIFLLCRNLAQGKSNKQRDMVALSRESSLFLNRNVCFHRAASLQTARVSEKRSRNICHGLWALAEEHGDAIIPGVV